MNEHPLIHSILAMNSGIHLKGYNNYYDGYVLEYNLDTWILKIHSVCPGKYKKGKEKYFVTLLHHNVYNPKHCGEEYHTQFSKVANAYFLSRYLCTHRYSRKVSERDRRAMDPVGYLLSHTNYTKPTT